jgi:oligopeptide/dipeptide ABC transporter ATP-binding protein
MSDRIAVMYLGKFVEIAPAKKLYTEPKHPYTMALLSAIPVADPDYEFNAIPIEGDVPSPIYLPQGCYFRSRCRFATDRCEKEIPQLQKIEEGHYVACFNPLNKDIVKKELNISKIH